MYITNHFVNPTFGIKIIDSHTHIGKHEGVEYGKSHLETFLSKLPNDDYVERMIVSDLDVLHGAVGQKEGNEALLRLLDKPNCFSVIASCNVNEDVASMQKLLSENEGKIFGLKFHPHLQNVPIINKQYRPYFQLATDKKLPCLIHTAVDLTQEGKHSGVVEKFADPREVYAMAKNYKETPFVLAHLGAGWNEAHSYTTDILIESIKNSDANLYADISWVDIDANNGSKDNIVKAIKRLKGIGEADWKYGDQSYRLMFGTDAPLDRFANTDERVKSYTKFIDEIKTAIKNDNDLKADADKIIDDLFYNNAKKLYKIPEGESFRTTPKSEKALSFVSKNIGKLVAGAGVLLAGVLLLLKYQDKKEQEKPSLSLVA